MDAPVALPAGRRAAILIGLTMALVSPLLPLRSLAHAVSGQSSLATDEAVW